MINFPFSKYPSYKEENLEYAYACGRIKALENTLLEPARISRLSEQKTPEELIKQLIDTYYGQFFKDIEHAYQFETAFINARSDILNLTTSLLTEEQLKTGLRSVYDFHNLKVAAKMIVSERLDHKSRAFYKISTIPPDKLLNLLKAEEYDKLPRFLADAYINSIELYFNSHDIKQIDISIDKSAFSYQTKEIPSAFLRHYYKIKADITNIFAYFRLDIIKQKELLSDYILQYGFVPVDIYLKASSCEDLIKDLYNTPYFDISQNGFNYLQKYSSFSLMEKGFENYIVGYLKSTRLAPVSSIPVLAFYLTRLHEIRVLRMIFTAKTVSLPEEKLKNRLPEIV